jgi:Calcium-binding EGF domain
MSSNTDFDKAVCCIADVDECSRAKHGCSVKCHNFPGGYNCTCHDGYKLNDDNRTCSGKTANFTAEQFISACINLFIGTGNANRNEGTIWTDQILLRLCWTSELS